MAAFPVIMELIMIFRKGTQTDLEAVVRIYNDIHSEEEAGLVSIGWKREIYPSAATAEAALLRDDLFVLEEDGTVLGAGIINQTQMDAYYNAPWEYEADDSGVCVLHTLVISPSASGRGLGRRFAAFYEEYARAHGWKELRIDTNAINTRARRMYHELGYKEIAVIPTEFNGIQNVNLLLLEKHLP